VRQDFVLKRKANTANLFANAGAPGKRFVVFSSLGGFVAERSTPVYHLTCIKNLHLPICRVKIRVDLECFCKSERAAMKEDSRGPLMQDPYRYSIDEVRYDRNLFFSNQLRETGPRLQTDLT